MNRRGGSEQFPRTTGGRKRLAAFARPAAGGTAAAVVCALMLLRRRRARAQRRASLQPTGGESTGGRGLFHALSQEDGSLAPARRTDRRSTAPAGGRSSAVVAGERVTGTSLERV